MGPGRGGGPSGPYRSERAARHRACPTVVVPPSARPAAPGHAAAPDASRVASGRGRPQLGADGPGRRASGGSGLGGPPGATGCGCSASAPRSSRGGVASPRCPAPAARRAAPLARRLQPPRARPDPAGRRPVPARQGHRGAPRPPRRRAASRRGRPRRRAVPRGDRADPRRRRGGPARSDRQRRRHGGRAPGDGDGRHRRHGDRDRARQAPRHLRGPDPEPAEARRSRQASDRRRSGHASAVLQDGRRGCGPVGASGRTTPRSARGRPASRPARIGDGLRARMNEVCGPISAATDSGPAPRAAPLERPVLFAPPVFVVSAMIRRTSAALRTSAAWASRGWAEASSWRKGRTAERGPRVTRPRACGSEQVKVIADPLGALRSSAPDPGRLASPPSASSLRLIETAKRRGAAPRVVLPPSGREVAALLGRGAAEEGALPAGAAEDAGPLIRGATLRRMRSRRAVLRAPSPAKGSRRAPDPGSSMPTAGPSGCRMTPDSPPPRVRSGDRRTRARRRRAGPGRGRAA